MRIALLALLLVSISNVSLAQQNELFSMSLEQLIHVQVKSTALVEEPLAHTSYSVTPSHRDDWERLGVRNLGELLNRMPSTVANIGRGASRVVAVRGYLDADPSAGIAVRFDGVPINKIREFGGTMALDGFDLNLLQSSELIRGPGSSLHGNAAFHGVLSLETLDPKGSGGHASVAFGSFDYSAAALTGNMSRAGSDLTLGMAYRNIGDVDQAYSYVDNNTGDPGVSARRNARKNSNLLAKYRHTSGAFNWHATIYGQKFDAQELVGAGTSGLGDHGPKDKTDYSDDMQLSKLGAEYAANDNSHVNAMMFYWQYQDRFHIDVTNLASIAQEYVTQREESHRGVQLHHTLDFGENQYLTYGYEYLVSRFEKFTRQERNPGEDWGDAFKLPGPGFERELHSVVVDGRQAVGNKGLLLSYGLRWDHYSDFSDQYTPRFGLSQALSKNQILHLTYGEGFRAPLLYERFRSGPVAANPNLEPERLKSIELKYTLATTTLFHNLTLFYNEWNETIEPYILETPINGAIVQFTNLGRSTAQGAEYQITGRWQSWLVEAAASYVHDKNETSGETYTRFPQWLADFNVGYQISSQWQLNCVNRYMIYENYLTNSGNSVNPDDYFRTDIVMNWANTFNWRLGVAIRNIFNRDNYVQYTDGRPEGLQDESRNVSAQVSYSF
ncbi:outer membrane cobalamin receptor [Alteromonadaceae bacterium 2753L.S.0a.02]|nr:outer membrane cobalamin receptor [Alteromonadaceae bacterium 2753L.S.0a.02]